LERSEVLLVEAQQFEHQGSRLVIPRLFGYTEEARRIKRTVNINRSGRRKWDETSFFERVSSQLPLTQSQEVRRIYDIALKHDLGIRWGSGEQNGSFNLIISDMSTKSLMTVSSDGRIQINRGWFTDSTEAVELMERFFIGIIEALGYPLSDIQYPSTGVDEWALSAKQLHEYFERFFASIG